MKHVQSRIQVRQGFTLIELLVVIAIIAILAAILFPVFAKVREKARQTACTSNLKQMSMALMQYKQDYDEYYPISTNPINSSIVQAFLDPYIKTTAVWSCPTQSGILSHDNFNPANTKMAAFTYGINGWGTRGEGAPYLGGSPFGRSSSPTTFRTDAQVAPGTIVMFCGNWTVDSRFGPVTLGVAPGVGITAVDQVTGWPTADSLNNTSGVSRAAMYFGQSPVSWEDSKIDPVGLFKHTGVVNLMFCDGHVKAMAPTSVRFTMWEAYYTGP